jgi:hypothetical protein
VPFASPTALYRLSKLASGGSASGFGSSGFSRDATTASRLARIDRVANIEEMKAGGWNNGISAFGDENSVDRIEFRFDSMVLGLRRLRYALHKSVGSLSRDR